MYRCKIHTYTLRMHTYIHTPTINPSIHPPRMIKECGISHEGYEKSDQFNLNNQTY